MFSFLPANRLYRHLLFWVSVVLYFLVPQLIYPDYIDTVTHYFFNFDYQHSPYFLLFLFGYVLGVGMLYAYAFLRWAMPPLLAGRYVAGVGLYVLVTVVICYLFRLIKGLHMAVLDPLLQREPIRPFDSRHFDDYFFNQVYIHEYSTIILILAVYRFFTNWQEKQQEANQLEREKISTEIQLLKTQVNPDFLFSSLERVKTLTQQRSKQAPTLLLDLAHFLRYVLYETKAETVTLALEVSTICQYVSLQKMLCSTNLEVALMIRGLIDHQRVVPLSLLPLVENAFDRLRPDTDEPVWVSVDLAVADTYLTLKVITGQTSSPADDQSQLATIQKQLYFHYGDAYNLQVIAESDAFIVTLTLNFPTNHEPSESIPSFLHHETTLPDRG
ncbi:MAG TPA: histidine kinase [Hymenobacter sp.]|nr:histidine kinase [Hymenobacter sp.]